MSLYKARHSLARPILRTTRASRYVTLAGIVVVCVTVAWVA